MMRHRAMTCIPMCLNWQKSSIVRFCLCIDNSNAGLLVVERNVVQSMFDNFKSHVHGEWVDKPTFVAIMKASGVENERVADHWFDVCDPNKDGKLVFREFLTAVTLMERGGWKERAECMLFLKELP